MTTPSPAIPEPPTKAPAWPRNAADSRQSLLAAAGDLFAERGFDRTTTRDIGERAGLDPTLITRYFGNKAGLYLATLRTDFAAEQPGALRDLLQPERMTQLLDRVARRGPGQIFDAALRRPADRNIENQASELLAERIVDPTYQALEATNTRDAQMRAEIIAAAFIGVAVCRHNGALPALPPHPRSRSSSCCRLSYRMSPPPRSDRDHHR